MKETSFIEQNREKWAQFEEMLRENRRDPEKLNDLFIQVTDDLSYARTFYPNRSVRIFLNSLAQKVFHNIYKGRQFPAGRFRRFWTDELPRVLWESRMALLLSFSLFVVSFSIGVVSSILNPDFARVMLGDGYVEMTLTNIEHGDPMAVYKESGPLGAAAGITANNMFIALQTAIFGVLASIGTVFILLYNGVMVGAFQYFFVEHGVFKESFLTIWIHGTLEISAIIIAGAAGLVAGSGLLFPGTYRRVQAFQLSMRRGLKIFFGIVPLIILAGSFEAFLTRFTETPDLIRGAFIFTSLFFVLWYFVWLPRHKARSGAFDTPIAENELPPSRVHVIDFRQIKTVGETFSDAFTTLSRHPRTTLLGLFATTSAFCVWAFSLSSRAPSETFPYSDNLEWPFVNQANIAQFFSNESAFGLYWFQVLLLAILTTSAFRALEGEMDLEQNPPFSLKRVGAATGVLTLVTACLALVLKYIGTYPGIFFSWIAIPFLTVWAAVIYFETLNPLTALLRAAKLIRLGPALGIGVLTGMLNVLFFKFLDSQLWDMSLQLLSWFVPPVQGAMSEFHAIATAAGAGVLTYFFCLLSLLCGGLQYYSFREIADAAGMYEELQRVGNNPKIRGLARE